MYAPKALVTNHEVRRTAQAVAAQKPLPEDREARPVAPRSPALTLVPLSMGVLSRNGKGPKVENRIGVRGNRAPTTNDKTMRLVNARAEDRSLNAREWDGGGRPPQPKVRTRIVRYAGGGGLGPVIQGIASCGSTRCRMRNLGEPQEAWSPSSERVGRSTPTFHRFLWSLSW